MLNAYHHVRDGEAIRDWIHCGFARTQKTSTTTVSTLDNGNRRPMTAHMSARRYYYTP